MNDKPNVRILTANQEAAIAVARVLVKAANSVRINPAFSGIEQISLESQLCALRDCIEVQDETNVNQTDKEKNMTDEINIEAIPIEFTGQELLTVALIMGEILKVLDEQKENGPPASYKILSLDLEPKKAKLFSKAWLKFYSKLQEIQQLAELMETET